MIREGINMQVVYGPGISALVSHFVSFPVDAEATDDIHNVYDYEHGDTGRDYMDFVVFSPTYADGVLVIGVTKGEDEHYYVYSAKDLCDDDVEAIVSHHAGFEWHIDDEPRMKRY